jgi:hypothetical protein
MANKRGPNNQPREHHASINSFPLRPEGEDDHTQKDHCDWLSAERRKAYPNREGVKRRMDLTYPDRRQTIVQDRKGVKEIIEQYPFMNDEEEVCHAF